MRPRGTLTLLAILALLCGAYAWLSSSQKRTEQAEQEAKRLFSFDAEDVKQIRIQRRGEPAMAAARREEGGWRITDPDAAILANSVVWERAAGALAHLSAARSVEVGPDDLAKYGLESPILTVEGLTEKGEEVRVIFGDIEPTRTYCYARASDSTVFLASYEDFFELNRSPLVLRDRGLINLGEDGISRVEIAYYWQSRAEADDAASDGQSQPGVGEESIPFVLAKESDGRWYVAEPFHALAVQEKADALVRKLESAQGRGYIDAPQSLDVYGLDPPRARATVTVAGGAPQTVYLGILTDEEEKDSAVYIRRADAPAVFLVDSGLVALFPNAPGDFREKRLLTHGSEEITGIRYVDDDLDIRMARGEGGTWRITYPVEVEADAYVIEGYIDIVNSLAAEDFLDEIRPEFGFDHPRLSITFTFADEAESATIRVGALNLEKESYYVQQDTGVPCLVFTSRLVPLQRTLFQFRSKERLSFVMSEAVRLELRFEGTEYVFEQDEGEWRVTAPAGKRLETQSDAAALVGALAHVKAVADEGEASDLAAYGLDDPLLRVTVMTRPRGRGAEEVEGPLIVGAPAPDKSRQRFAMMQGAGEVFRVDQGLIDLARSTLRGVVDAS